MVRVPRDLYSSKEMFPLFISYSIRIEEVSFYMVIVIGTTTEMRFRLQVKDVAKALNEFC